MIWRCMWDVDVLGTCGCGAREGAGNGRIVGPCPGDTILVYVGACGVGICAIVGPGDSVRRLRSGMWSA